MPELCLYYILQKHYYQNGTTGNCWFKQPQSRLESFINLCLGNSSTRACIYTHNNKCNFMVPHPVPSTFSIILSRRTSFFFLATKRCSALLTSSHKPQRSCKTIITLNLILGHGSYVFYYLLMHTSGHVSKSC